METLKVGFIGAGPRARSLSQYLIFNEKNGERVELTCVLDSNPEELNDWRYKVVGDGLFSNFDQLLKFDDLDAVLIITPPATHANFAEKCLQAGIHVWSEVPMGLSNDKLFRIVDAEKGNKGNKGRYFYGENYCYMPHIQFMANKNRNDKIGEIYYTEGEYCHSIEHYMVMENYKIQEGSEAEIDPETAENITPTWRADFQPILYGHHVGPSFYVLNRNPQNIIEIPTEVTGYGNMKMLKRFNTDNFQVCLCKTSQDTIGKFKAAFVMAHKGRTFHSFWSSRGLFESEHYNAKNYYLEVPKEKGMYPQRHSVEGGVLTPEEINVYNQNLATGHGGADPLMMEIWLDNIFNNEPMDIDAVSGAEWTSVGLCALDSIKTGKPVEVPKFR